MAIKTVCNAVQSCQFLQTMRQDI